MAERVLMRAELIDEGKRKEEIRKMKTTTRLPTEKKRRTIKEKHTL